MIDSAWEWAVMRPDKHIVNLGWDEGEARGYVAQGNSDGSERYRLLRRPVAAWEDVTPVAKDSSRA